MSGNTFGLLYCVTSFGESHGPAYGGVVDGCPTGLELTESDIQRDLDRRKPGSSRHVTQRQESDRIEILSGVFEGRTTGTAIGFVIRNEDQRSKDYSALADTFRPGHADYTYWQKYGLPGAKGVGERAVVLAPLVFVSYDKADRRAGRPAFEHTGQNLDAVGLLALRHVAGAAGLPPVEVSLDVALGELEPGGAAVNDASVRGPVALTKRGHAVEQTESVA